MPLNRWPLERGSSAWVAMEGLQTLAANTHTALLHTAHTRTQHIWQREVGKLGPTCLSYKARG